MSRLEGISDAQFQPRLNRRAVPVTTTQKDNYYVIGSMEERWQGKGAELLGLEGKVDKQVFTELLQENYLMAAT